MSKLGHEPKLQSPVCLTARPGHSSWLFKRFIFEENSYDGKYSLKSWHCMYTKVLQEHGLLAATKWTRYLQSERFLRFMSSIEENWKLIWWWLHSSLRYLIDLRTKTKQEKNKSPQQFIKVIDVRSETTEDIFNRAQFHGSAYCQLLRIWPPFTAYCEAPNFCASCVSARMPSNRKYACTQAKISR